MLRQPRHPLPPEHQKRIQDLNLRESLGSFSSIRLNQTLPQSMEMDSELVSERCRNMAFEGRLTIFERQEDFHIEVLNSEVSLPNVPDLIRHFLGVCRCM